MGIFTILAHRFHHRGRTTTRRQRARRRSMQVSQLAPRRLEPRRLLDASAPAMMLSGLEGLGDYVQVGDLLDSSQVAPGGSDVAAAPAQSPPLNPCQFNQSPSHVLVVPLGPVAEDGLATFLVSFRDPNPSDTHSIEIDWGDGSPTTTVTPNVGPRHAVVSHQYLDDDPSGTSADFYTVEATVTDQCGASASRTAPQLVYNVGPSNLQFATTGPVDEGSAATLQLTFDDPGTLDTHTVEVDWGDGYQTVGSATGGAFSSDHVYADDGQYTVGVRVTDDDGGVVEGSTQVTVRNVDPTLSLVGTQTFDEGEVFTITDMATFTDPGFDNPLNTLDPSNGGETTETFTYLVNWGDGTPVDSGSATVDLAGSPGTPTAGSFDGLHVYADNGTYTVQVMLLDDDGGAAIGSFQVVVNNVDPTIGGTTPIPTALEGQTFTLSSLGVLIHDPGFDNPLNPLQSGGSQETFTATTIDWGDGSAVETLTVGSRTSGGPGVPTTAELVHTPHTYADNGIYTVTVRIADDDGGLVERSFQLQVLNVAPTLTLTGDPQVVDEGSLLVIPNLGTFTDPGFDNPQNTHDPSNGGETTETFTYSIDWGDGTVETGQLPASVVPGGVGVPTTGSLAASQHTYADNNTDLFGAIIPYTVTVTLSDDDGGTTSSSIQVMVNNVDPVLTTLTGTDINSLGKTTLSGEFYDPGADTFVLEIDWRDGHVEYVPMSGPTPQSFSITHGYSGPPDPLHPAADVEIKVRLLDDDAGLDTGSVFVSNPGEGKQAVRIDTTPQVPRLVFPRRVELAAFTGGESSTVEMVSSSSMQSASGDIKAIGDRYYELREIKPDGTVGEGHRLKDDALADLPGLFHTLPDGRYVLYLVRTETNSRRLVLMFDIRGGKAVDLGDQSEGSRDRPPTDEGFQSPSPPEQIDLPEQDLPGAESAVELPQQTANPEAPAEMQGATAGSSSSAEPGAISTATPAGQATPSSNPVSLAFGGGLLAVLAKSSAQQRSAEPWSEAVDRTLAQADKYRWRRLRRLARGR